MKHTFFARVTIITILFGAMYTSLHMINRSLANDMPQLLATQAAKQLDAGMGLQSISMGGTDLANNPMPFVVVHDKKGKVVGGSGYLDSKLTAMPAGVVEHAKPGRPHAVTWAPRKDIRIASVTVAAKEYYVTGGQSLRSTDNRDVRVGWMLLAGYVLALGVLALAMFCRRKYGAGGTMCCMSGQGYCTCGLKSKSADAIVPTASKPKMAQSNTASVVKKPAAKKPRASATTRPNKK